MQGLGSWKLMLCQSDGIEYWSLVDCQFGLGRIGCRCLLCWAVMARKHSVVRRQDRDRRMRLLSGWFLMPLFVLGQGFALLASSTAEACRHLRRCV